MYLKFKYRVDLGDEGKVVTMSRFFKIGKKLVGLQVQGARPVTVEFNKEELEYLISKPRYLEHIKNTLKND